MMSAHRTEQPSSVSPGRPGSAVFPTNPLGEKHEGIPTGRDVEWEPLVDFRRMDVSENTIHGAIAWAHGDEIIHSFGGNVLVYGRSMMKLLMMKAFTEALDKELDWTQKAISCSSHNGDTEHVAAAQSLLSESEWGLMQCPLDVPLIQFGRQVRRPRRWFHTCSGEHAAILNAMRVMGMNHEDEAGVEAAKEAQLDELIEAVALRGRQLGLSDVKITEAVHNYLKRYES